MKELIRYGVIGIGGMGANHANLFLQNKIDNARLSSICDKNQSFSKNMNDGLKLNSAYITNILKCVPPGDKPHLDELNNCSNFFDNEISKLKKLKVIITLGKVAFDNYIKFYKKSYEVDKKIIFKHGKKYLLPDGKFLIPSYHPSPRNVNTKLINLKMMKNLFIKAKQLT